MGLIRNLKGKTVTNAFKEGYRKIFEDGRICMFSRAYDDEIKKYKSGLNFERAREKVKEIIKGLKIKASNCKSSIARDNSNSYTERDKMVLLKIIDEIEADVHKALESKRGAEEISKNFKNKLEKVISLAGIKYDFYKSIIDMQSFEIVTKEEDGGYSTSLNIEPSNETLAEDIKKYLFRNCSNETKLNKNEKDKVYKRYLQLKKDINGYRKTRNLGPVT